MQLNNYYYYDELISSQSTNLMHSLALKAINMNYYTLEPVKGSQVPLWELQFDKLKPYIFQHNAFKPVMIWQCG